MAFAISIIEYLLIPATVISTGVVLSVDYINNKNRSQKIFGTNKDSILNNTKEVNFRIVEINNNNTHEIENKFKEALNTSEKVTKEPITFSYKPSSDNESPIKAKISFVLEPDSINWKEEEELNLALVSTVYTIKRWIPKNHDSSQGLPECRYSWASKSLANNKVEPGLVNKYLENLKTLVNNANEKCSTSGTKGLTKSTR